MALITIGRVADRSGLAASAIRYYEREGLLPQAERHHGRRIYDEKILFRLSLIQLVRSAGFSVAETRALLNGFERNSPPGKHLRTMANQKISELDERIAEAQRMKRVLAGVVDCKCPTFDDCTEALARRGSCP